MAKSTSPLYYRGEADFSHSKIVKLQRLEGSANVMRKSKPGASLDCSDCSIVRIGGQGLAASPCRANAIAARPTSTAGLKLLIPAKPPSATQPSTSPPLDAPVDSQSPWCLTNRQGPSNELGRPDYGGRLTGTVISVDRGVRVGRPSCTGRSTESLRSVDRLGCFS